MDETLNTGIESAPFAPKSYSTSSNLQHTHTHTQIHQPFVLLLICLAGSKKRIQIGELTKSLTGGLMITKTTQRPKVLYSDLKSVLIPDLLLPFLPSRWKSSGWQDSTFFSFSGLHWYFPRSEQQKDMLLYSDYYYNLLHTDRCLFCI